MPVNDPNYDLIPEGTIRNGLVAPMILGESSPLIAELKAETIMAIKELAPISLRTPSVGFKPLRYPWALNLWQEHERVHWMPEEADLGPDVMDWERHLNPGEKNLLTQVFRLFTKSDEEVANNYMTRLGGLFKPTEIQMMLASFGNREGTHVNAYSLLLETVGMPEAEYSAFSSYEAMKAKVDHWSSFRVDTDADILRTLAMFGGFAEGLQIFASFAMLMNFPRQNKMKGMGQVVSWSVRDESIHCEGIIKLYHQFAMESGALTRAVKDEICDTAETVIRLEDNFIDLAFEMGGVEGMEPDDVKAYIRFVKDWRLYQLGLAEAPTRPNPLPWLQSLLSGVEHANFFETKSTAYSKAASRGTYLDVWDRFDRLQGNR